MHCPGIPGADKTICTAIVIEDLRNQILSDSSIGLAYVYHSYARREERSRHSLLRSLLKQLVEPFEVISVNVRKLFDEHKTMQKTTVFVGLAKSSCFRY